MLTEVFPKLENSNAVRLVRAFFRSLWYPAAAVLLMVLSELFGLELPVYWLYAAFGAVGVFFCEDALAVLPLACCGYMTFSAQNNPGQYPETTAFARPDVIVQFAAIVVIAALLLVGKLVFMLSTRPRRGAPRLWSGFAFLGLAFALAGLASPYYAGNTVLFGLLEIVCLSGLYFFFFFTVDWETVPKHYVPALFLFLGLGMIAEICGMYAQPGVVTEAGVVRGDLFTGWGIYNNVGCVMAMCMPAPFYFAVKCRNGWGFSLLGCLFALAVVLTQSRAAILFGAVLFAVCVVWTVVATHGKERLFHLIAFAGLAAAAVATFFALRERIEPLFRSLVAAGTDNFLRFETYRRCWERFTEYPFFGAGFYHTPGTVLIDGDMYTADEALAGTFYPPRAHDTFFQLIATGGAFALGAYVFHRVQTAVLLFHRPSDEKLFAAFSVLALLLTSLLDCHFFNLGPGLLYSVLLVSAERSGSPVRST